MSSPYKLCDFLNRKEQLTLAKRIGASPTYYPPFLPADVFHWRDR